MKKIYGIAVGASLTLAAFASSPASALPLAAGLGATASDTAGVGMIDQVQYRRGYGGPRRGYYYGGRRGGISPGAAVAGVAALGILGAAAAASAQPRYYPAPAYGYGAPYYGGCYWERRPVYDAWGNPRGTHPFQVCR